MIDVIVKNILFFAKAAVPGYTLFLQSSEDDSKSLPIVIGQFEAQSIALAMEQITLNRPLTHDLLSAVIESTTDGLESVAIYDLKDGTFYAHLNIWKDGKLETIDARPSDAIALALKARVPIRVDARIFNDAAVPIPGREEQESQSNNSFADNVNEIARQAEIRYDLEKDLREAISREDYEQAARIRDRLHTLMGE
ncbi:MAG: bifunctional nuclease family protein [Candidatus Marinimicrobia bacterium]|nr:bifunctional nuclease family protein [Candidatus Neomarinimicrobiota bacterium]